MVGLLVCLAHSARAFVAICGGSACMMPRDGFDNSSLSLTSSSVNVTLEFYRKKQQSYATQPALRAVAYSVTKQLNTSNCAYNHTLAHVPADGISWPSTEHENLKCKYTLTFYSEDAALCASTLKHVVTSHTTRHALVKVIKAQDGAGLMNTLNVFL